MAARLAVAQGRALVHDLIAVTIRRCSSQTHHAPQASDQGPATLTAKAATVARQVNLQIAYGASPSFAMHAT